MTGPEHYLRAEALLEAAIIPDCGLNDTTRKFAIAQAQVHATLALAAASASCGVTWLPDQHDEKWAEVIS